MWCTLPERFFALRAQGEATMSHPPLNRASGTARQCRPRRRGIVNLLGLLTASVVGCLPLPAGPPKNVELGVPPFMQAQPLWCGEATVQMWSAYMGNPVGQEAVLQYVQTHYPQFVGGFGSLAPEGIALAASYFTGLTIRSDFYTYDERRLAVADQKKSLVGSHPTIAITRRGTHAVILVGAAWHSLDTLQPHADYVTFHDPDWAPWTQRTVGHWMDSEALACSDGAV